MTVGTALLRMPTDPDRYALQHGLLAAHRVREVVERNGGRYGYLETALELKHLGCSTGAALAAVKRALIYGDVVLVDGDLELPGPGGGAAA